MEYKDEWNDITSPWAQVVGWLTESASLEMLECWRHCLLNFPERDNFTPQKKKKKKKGGNDYEWLKTKSILKDIR